MPKPSIPFFRQAVPRRRRLAVAAAMLAAPAFVRNGLAQLPRPLTTQLYVDGDPQNERGFRSSSRRDSRDGK